MIAKVLTDRTTSKETSPIIIEKPIPRMAKPLHGIVRTKRMTSVSGCVSVKSGDMAEAP